MDCFNPTVACFPIRILPVYQVIDLLACLPPTEVTGRYREAMLQGNRFPPVAVVRIGGRFFVADGHKRLTAYKSFGHAEIPVEVWTRSRWLQDQWEQLRRNLGKKRKLLISLVAQPGESRRLALSTLRHHQCLARALWGLVWGNGRRRSA